MQVALPVPRGETYDYLCPQPVTVGARVRVPFGPRRLSGLVIAITQHSELATDRLRAVQKVLDETPLLGAADLELLKFASRYYQAPLGQVVATALPTMLRQGKAATPLVEMRWQVTPAGRDFDPAELRRAAKQAIALSALKAAKSPLASAQIGAEGCSPAILKALQDKGLISSTRTLDLQASDATAPELNPAQSAAVEQIRSSTGFGCFLLDGVTGSGKTEVYLNLAREQAAQGRQTLILVPEIGLTPQMVARVQAHTGAKTVAFGPSGWRASQRLVGGA